MSETLSAPEFPTRSPTRSPIVALARKLAPMLEEMAYSLYEFAEATEPTPTEYQFLWVIHAAGTQPYNLTPIQKEVVLTLFHSRKQLDETGRSNPYMSERAVLAAVGANPATTVRLHDLFRGSKAWGRLIKWSKKRGMFYLCGAAHADLERDEVPATLRRQCPGHAPKSPSRRVPA